LVIRRKIILQNLEEFNIFLMAFIKPIENNNNSQLCNREFLLVDLVRCFLLIIVKKVVLSVRIKKKRDGKC
jgi:hypothetical protein